MNFHTKVQMRDVSKALRSHSCGGFALVIALSLMAFVLLLLISLTSLVRVESTGSQQQMTKLQAQANALLALNIAIGELQEHTGSDQRVTATADIAARNAAGDRLGEGQVVENDISLDSSLKGLSQVEHGTRYWTGVWENNDNPTDIYTKTPSAQLRTWLVSGNEDAAASALPFRPNLGASLNPGDTIVALPNGREAVVLVSAESVGSESTTSSFFTNFGVDSPQAEDAESDLARYVMAPLVPLADAANEGAYAYWIGDEGVKARYNLRDPNAAAGTGSPGTEIRARIAPRVGVELTTASDLAQPAPGSALQNFSNTPDPVYDGYPFPGNASDAEIESLAKVYSMELAPLVHFANPDANDEPLRKRFHTLTASSRGLQTDTLSGGLKKDLSLALEDTGMYAAIFASDPQILPNAVSPNTGPNWSTIRDFYDMANRAARTINLNAAGLEGVRPLITELRLLFKLYPNRISGNWEIRIGVGIGVGNPYTVPMSTTGLNVEFDRLGQDNDSGNYFDFGDSSFWGSWWVWALKDSDGAGPLAEQAAAAQANRLESFKVINQGDSQDTTPSSVWTLTGGQTAFKLPATIWQPGEVKLFALDNRTQAVGASPGGTVDLAEMSNSPLESHYITYDTGVSLPDDDLPSTNYDAWLQFRRELAGWGGRWNPVGFTVSLLAPTGNLLTRADIFNLYTAGPSTPLATSNVDLDGGIFAGSLHLYLALPHAESYTGSYGIDRRSPYTFRPFIDHNLRAAWHPPASFSRTDNVASAFSYTGKRTNASIDYTAALYGWGGSFANANNTTWPRFTLYDLPFRVDPDAPPIMSLAGLQHADLTADDSRQSVGHQSGLAVGNSFYTPLLSRDQSFATRTATTYTPDRDIRFFDISYLLNARLFDGYFLSSYPGGALGVTLPNPRFTITSSDTFLATGGGAEAGTGPAASLAVEGAFNINSTSPEAWAAVLASTNRVPVNGDNLNKGTPFARSLNPIEDSDQAAHGNAADSYAGYRRLTDRQIRELSWQIVRQVRQRGPFVSLAHFVNRALVPATAAAPAANWGLSGALQSALDATSINDLPGLTTDWVEPIPGAHDGMSVEEFWPDAAVDFPALLTATASGERPPQGNRSTGIPGILTQADILQVLTPTLTARSDTFRIRAYGSIPSLDGSIAAQAWCEAVLQRQHDYVNPANVPGAAASTLNAINRQFGRRYEIVSFRWLQSDEI